MKKVSIVEILRNAFPEKDRQQNFYLQKQIFQKWIDELQQQVTWKTQSDADIVSESKTLIDSFTDNREDSPEQTVRDAINAPHSVQSTLERNKIKSESFNYEIDLLNQFIEALKPQFKELTGDTYVPKNIRLKTRNQSNTDVLSYFTKKAS